MKITIITPVFNGIDHIKGCLDNIIAQSTQEIEHVVIDGGSQDGTIDVLREYGSRFLHIRWISEPDRGQSDALNKGVKLASGDIVGILNVDDRYEPGVLTRVRGIFREAVEPAVMVANCNIRGENGKILFFNRPGKFNRFFMTLGQCVNPLPANPSAYFHHMSLFDKIGLFDVDLHYEMDWDFLFRAAGHANFYYFDETWGNFLMGMTTKTVTDIRAGKNPSRVRALLHRHRKSLPLHLQWISSIIFSVFNNQIFCPALYFVYNPSELIGRLSARVRGVPFEYPG